MNDGYYTIFSGSLKGAIIAIGTAVLTLIGNLPLPIFVLFGLNILDCYSGIVASVSQGKSYKSKISFIGVQKKILRYLLIFVGYGIDLLLAYSSQMMDLQNLLGIEFNQHYLIFTYLFVFWLIALEFSSIGENYLVLGSELPSWFTKFIDIFRNGIEKTGNKAVNEITKGGKDNE